MQYAIMTVIASVLLVGTGGVAAANAEIPDWVRSVAGFWSQGLISDDAYMSTLSYLIEQGIIVVEVEANEASGQTLDLTPGAVSGTITRVIDGNTVEIDNMRIRLPLIDVEDSGNSTMPHAALARETCPVGTAAHYDVDNGQQVGKYGRTIAMVWCDGISLDRTMVDSGLGWVNTYYCERSEFSYLWRECVCSDVGN